MYSVQGALTTNCCCMQSIEAAIGGNAYQHNKVNQWTSNVVEQCLNQLTKLAKPFKYIGRSIVSILECISFLLFRQVSLLIIVKLTYFGAEFETEYATFLEPGRCRNVAYYVSNSAPK